MVLPRTSTGLDQTDSNGSSRLNDSVQVEEFSMNQDLGLGSGWLYDLVKVRISREALKVFHEEFSTVRYYPF